MPIVRDTVDLEVYERNNNVLQAQIFQQDGVTPLSLTGVTVEFYVKTLEQDADAAALQKLTSASATEIEITNSAQGIVLIKVPSNSPAVTKSATYRWRLDALLNGGTERKTCSRGSWKVKGI